MDENDSIRLQHMLDAAREAQNFAAGRTREALDSDTMLAFALTRAIEMIGEAASKVSDELQDSTPQIPWHNIIGMRNRIIHAYFDVNLDRLWDTVIHSLPALIIELEKLLPPEHSEE